MKNSIEIDVMKKGAKDTAEPICNIFYAVCIHIGHINSKGVHSTVLEKETIFKEERAIDAREKAFNHAARLFIDSQTDGKLYKHHLDSPEEAGIKDMKNIYMLSITIECLDGKTGDREVISDGGFFEYPEEYFDYLLAELMLYKEYNYDVDDWVITVNDYRDEPREILNYNMIDVAKIVGLMKSLKKNDVSTQSAKEMITSTSNDAPKLVKNPYMYYFKTPIEVWEKCKVMYLVNYYQFSPNNMIPSFPDEQNMEFVDPNPIEARRQAFKFARSYNTKPVEYQSDKKGNLLPEGNSTMPDLRWCRIYFIEYGETYKELVYLEGQNDLTPDFLEGLGDELDMYRKYGYTTGYDVIKIADEDGKSHEVIAEENGFSS